MVVPRVVLLPPRLPPLHLQPRLVQPQVLVRVLLLQPLQLYL